MRSDTQSGPEKDVPGKAEEKASATESTNAVGNHDQLIESIQNFFGSARKRTENGDDEIAAIPRV